MKKMLAIVLTLVMMLSCLSIATAETNVWDPATAKIDWKQFAGTELRLYMLQHMVTQAIEPYLGEFEGQPRDAAGERLQLQDAHRAQQRL